MAVIDAWVAPTAKQKFVKQPVDLGPLGAEEVEVQVEHCGICHSDLSVLNDDWGMSTYPAVLGHEAVGTVVEVGAAAKGLRAGQRVGIGWTAGSCMHCRPCKSGDQHLCAGPSRPSSATGARSPAGSGRTGRGPSRSRRTCRPPTPARSCAAGSPCSTRSPCTPSRPTGSGSWASGGSGTWA